MMMSRFQCQEEKQVEVCLLLRQADRQESNVMLIVEFCSSPRMELFNSDCVGLVNSLG
jgi:hypothetical protein